MNIISAYLKKTGSLLLAAITASLVLSSCDSAIFDYEGDCSVIYRVKFRYDRNMKWADAFAQEVESVHLYAFDSDSVLVWQKSERGTTLAAQDYAMTLELPAAEYHLVAWCGLENDGTRAESFTVPAMQAGKSRLSELSCTLNRKYAAGGAYSDEQLYPLFHGMLDVTLPTDDDGGEYTYTMPLTKNTNHVRIILQHLSGEDVNVNDFTFRIEEQNGFMNHDNGLLPDEKITYRPYSTRAGSAGLGLDDYPEMNGAKAARRTTRAITSVSVGIADMTVARLMEDRKTYLTIETTEGERVAKIPLTDYALLLMDGYGREMTPQDYLDRQDEYALTFFLDEQRKWVATSIIINSWKVVLNDVDF